MDEYTLDNIYKLLAKMQVDNCKLRHLADEITVSIDRALLRLEIQIKRTEK